VTKKPTYEELEQRVNELEKDAIVLKREVTRNKHQAKFMNLILESIPYPFYVIDAFDYTVKKVNHAAYPGRLPKGTPCFVLTHKRNKPCDSAEHPCPLEIVKTTKQPVTVEHLHYDNDGNFINVEINAFPIFDSEGNVSQIIEYCLDVSQRKRLERQLENRTKEITRRLEHMVEERTQQLKETHDKLLHQDKMASLGKLSASVVHEINNPIAGILNLTMLIKRIVEEGSVNQEKDLEQFLHYLDLMETETRRISRIVTSLLAFSRESKMEFKKVDINRLIEKTLFLNANLLKINGVKVEKRFYDSLPKIIGSEDQLQQVFMNIISNAAETIEDSGGGVMSVETKYLPKSDRISAIFKDTGMAIPKENVSKIFEPFFTSKKGGKGVGLGLSVAYGIVIDHDGTIYVEPKEGEGNTFTVKLPLKPSSVNSLV
jgi:two-component system NtrC family sensor kinase